MILLVTDKIEADASVRTSWPNRHQNSLPAIVNPLPFFPMSHPLDYSTPFGTNTPSSSFSQIVGHDHLQAVMTKILGYLRQRSPVVHFAPATSPADVLLAGG